MKDVVNQCLEFGFGEVWELFKYSVFDELRLINSFSTVVDK